MTYFTCTLLDTVDWPVRDTENAISLGRPKVCCERMQFALSHALVRQIDGVHFGTDVLPPPLTANIVACPWCGKPVD